MSFAQGITDLLNADATLMAILTGAVHNYPDAGRNGLNRIQIPGAFDPQVGLVKPVAMVAEFAETPDGQITDTMTQTLSTQTPIIIRVWDNGDSGYQNAIIPAAARIYALLAFQQIVATSNTPPAVQMLPGRVLKDRRESTLKDSCYYDLYYTVHAYHS